VDNFRIGQAYLVEPSLNRLTGPGGSVRLEPKVMMVLVCLAERAGLMVPKDRLLHSGWADTAVGDDVLTRAVSELRRLFEDDPKQPRVIETIPKSGYRLIAPVERLPRDREVAPTTLPASEAHGADRLPAQESPARRLEPWPRRLIVVGVAGIVVVALASAWLRRAPRTPPAPAMRVVSLTSMNGSEYGGAFSPDGRQVTFAWDGEEQNNFDIYVKLVGSPEVRRLTTDPGIDLAGIWSPDGRQIAYARAGPPSTGTWQLRVVSSLGGGDRKISDFPTWLGAVWSPDGRYLAAGRAGPPDAAHPTNGIYLIPVEGGEPRAITRPRAPGVDQSPAFSPDGHRLAYASCQDEWRGYCQVKVVDLDAAFGAVGAPRQLTGLLPMGRSNITWSRDATFVIFNAEEVQLSYLWRVGVDGEHPPERIETAGVNAFFPTISLSGDRLAFSRVTHDRDIYRFQPGRATQPVARSSVADDAPQFSPDGRRIVFCSLRSGDALRVWVANSDGSSPEQLTHGAGPFECGPSWSPDGRQIAFESQAVDGHPHIWTVDTEGGTPRQITNDPGDQMDPTWSQDGEWIYFSWSRTTDRDIWRTRVRTGSKERVTRGGGFIAHESADGATLLYIPKAVESPLVAQPLAGGAPHPVISCVAGTAFSVTPAGVYYIPCSRNPQTPDPDPLVRVFDPATAKVREVGRLEKFEWDILPSSFAVSADGGTILYGRLVRDGSDLMVIENFK
jgi:Tol biopolymer transport system component/DNA-binding winged helix-turn-helix (wHTH) protein